MQASNSTKDWFFNIPTITRCYLVILLTLGLTSTMGIYSIGDLSFDLESVIKHFQFNRLIGNFMFIGRPSLNFFITLMIILQYMGALEQTPLSCTQGGAGDKADFVFCLLWGCVLSLISGWCIGLPFCSYILIDYLVYVWSKKFSDTTFKYYGIPVTGFYIPYVMMGVSLLMGSSILVNILGIVTGHIFYFFTQVFETTKNTRFFSTPLWLRKALSLPTNAPKTAADYSVHYLGGGHVLGTAQE
ncbi:hypothetical protein WA158_000304 [Blastocystis sp. Blastoise]